MHMQLNSGSSTCSAHTALIYQIQRSGWYAFLMFAIYDQTHGNIVLTRVPPAFFCFFSVFSPPILPILPTFQILPTLPITIGFSPVVLSEGQSKDMACQSFQCIVKSSRHFLITSLGFFNKILLNSYPFSSFSQTELTICFNCLKLSKMMMHCYFLIKSKKRIVRCGDVRTFWPQI